MRKGLRWIPITLGAIVALGVIAFAATKQFTNAAEGNLPTFITANPIDPAVVNSVPKFRSTASHSNPGWPEMCRSMKRYVNANDPSKPSKQITMADRAQSPPADYALGRERNGRAHDHRYVHGLEARGGRESVRGRSGRLPTLKPVESAPSRRRWFGVDKKP